MITMELDEHDHRDERDERIISFLAFWERDLGKIPWPGEGCDAGYVGRKLYGNRRSAAAATLLLDRLVEEGWVCRMKEYRFSPVYVLSNSARIKYRDMLPHVRAATEEDA